MNTNIICTPDFLDVISGATIVVDTCVIIDASKIEYLNNFLRELPEHDCMLLSVPPVKNEFLAAADSAEDYNRLNEYLESLPLVFLSPDIENRLNNEGEDFSIALRRSKVKNPGFVDRLVLAIPFLYRESSEKVYVLTSNHKDVPHEFFDRIGFITIDKGDEFAQIGLYKFNDEKFNKIIKKK